ncbi:MAG: hypothetical protein PHR35_07705, partial [Kiritimatiellae bacterium]|nr:hypothetical protein [Kiritimatiellia bacterium]
FDTLADNAARLAPGATAAMALMRRARQGSLAATLEGASAGQRWRCACFRDEAHCAVVRHGKREVYVFAALQVAARERLEALGLIGDADIPDGRPLAETLARLRGAGLLPALAWGLGKWLGPRGGIVRATLSVAAPGELLIGDSAMRPSCWGTPLPMAAAQRRGLRVLYGSDSLPRYDEERVAGQYATLIAGELNPNTPSASLRRLLLDPRVDVRPVGHRHGLIATLRRL